MSDAIDYATPGPLTDLDGIKPSTLEEIPASPADICALVHGLVIQPHDATALDVPPERLAENQLRSASALIEALLALDPAPLAAPREPAKRVIGTCRHFAVLSCALLRYRGIAARARCGFGMYFQAGKGLDHWITEYWQENESRWVRIDSETLGSSAVPHPEDLSFSDFYAGGEAWILFRDGHIDAAEFGVYGTTNFGPAEIRGNAIRDLAALNKVEMLPWDEWGRMRASYEGATGDDYDELLDEISEACTAGGPADLTDLYGRDELGVPPALTS